MAKKGSKFKKYSPKFKISVILDMREHDLGYNETMRKYNLTGCTTVQSWERIYLEEGEAGFYIERRGRTRKMNNSKIGRPRKKPLDKKVKEDLIAENQRLREENLYLRAEMDYLKKLDALVRAEEQKKSKKRK